MQIKNQKLENYCLCGYAVLLIHNILMSFSTIAVSGYVQMFLLAAAACCTIGMIWETRYFSYKEAGITAFILTASFFGYQTSGKMDMLYFIFLLFFLKDVSAEEFLVTDLKVRSFLVSSLFLLSKFGIITDRIFLSGSVRRYGCGFNNPNTFGFMLFIIFSEYLILYSRQNLKQIPVLAILFSVIIYFFSGTKTAIMLIAIFAVIYFTVQARKINMKPKAAVFILIPPAITLLLTMAYTARNGLAMTINRLMTGRLAFYKSFYRRYPPSLFGHKVVYISSAMSHKYKISALVCDNVYLYLLCNLGIIAFLIWMTSLFMASYWQLRENNTNSFLFLMMLGIYGIAENTMGNPMMFPGIIFCAEAFAMLLHRNLHIFDHFAEENTHMRQKYNLEREGIKNVQRAY